MSEHSKNSPEITIPLNLKVKDFSHCPGAVFTQLATLIKHRLNVIRQDYLFNFFRHFCEAANCKYFEFHFIGSALISPKHSAIQRNCDLIETAVILIKTVTKHNWIKRSF